MPFRAFGDSDANESRSIRIPVRAHEFQCPFGHSGILTDGCRNGGGYLLVVFQCPFGHSGILTHSSKDSSVRQYPPVSMPFRAFGDSDLKHIVVMWADGKGFQCPFGHSGILTRKMESPIKIYREFQCPFGHSGILTSAAAQQRGDQEGVSMPFRAFGDSDLVRGRENRGPLVSFNALSGIRGF